MPGERVPGLAVAVVGSGPSGLYAADALLRGAEGTDVRVDVWDRLPTPFGLVRYGVAPDHAKMKNVIAVLQRVFDDERVRFVGGVEVGPGDGHVSHDALLEAYDAVLWATGAATDRHLDVPGEELPGSCAATELVAWYSGHPDAVAPLDLAAPHVRAAVVLGVGNVAVDVARLLSKDAEALRSTDVPRAVLASLAASRLREVHVVGRRGPQHATWTTKELRELGELDGVAVVVDRPDDVRDALAGPEAEDRHVRANLEVLAGWAERPAPEAGERVLRLRFWSRPVAVLGTGSAQGVRLERTALGPDGRLAGTGEVVDVEAQVVVRAVGYRARPVPGLPFDEVAGVVPHDGGRVLGPDGAPAPREYVAGWLKRGPHGVIGTNKGDAAETVRALLEDAAVLVGAAAGPDALLSGLEERCGVRPVSYAGWLAIDAAEVEEGRPDGAARVKVVEWERLRALAADARESTSDHPCQDPAEGPHGL